MIKKEFDNEESAIGAMFTIKNNFHIEKYSIGVDGKTLIIDGMDEKAFEIFKKSLDWDLIEVFGLFVKIKQIVNDVVIDFDEAYDKKDFIIDVADSLEEIAKKAKQILK